MPSWRRASAGVLAFWTVPLCSVSPSLLDATTPRRHDATDEGTRVSRVVASWRRGVVASRSDERHKHPGPQGAPKPMLPRPRATGHGLAGGADGDGARQRAGLLRG